MVDNYVINGVWHGDRPLTNIQKLCIRSYQANGHQFQLWTTAGRVPDVPAGTVIRDTYEILPYKVPMFVGENYFSDYFRVLLIQKIGGWYVDLDTVCLQHFDIGDDRAFVSESRLGPMKQPGEAPGTASNQVQEYLSGCIFKAPQGDPMMQYILDRIEMMDTLHPRNWICMGPELFQEAIPRFNYRGFVQPPSVFDALNYNDYELFVSGGVDWPAWPSEALSIHLRTSFWQEKYHPILKPNGVFPADSMYERLKAKYGVTNV